MNTGTSVAAARQWRHVWQNGRLLRNGPARLNRSGTVGRRATTQALKGFEDAGHTVGDDTDTWPCPCYCRQAVTRGGGAIQQEPGFKRRGETPATGNDGDGIGSVARGHCAADSGSHNRARADSAKSPDCYRRGRDRSHHEYRCIDRCFGLVISGDGKAPDVALCAVMRPRTTWFSNRHGRRRIEAACSQQRSTGWPVLALLDVPQVTAFLASKEVGVRREQDGVERGHPSTTAFRALRSC